MEKKQILYNTIIHLMGAICRIAHCMLLQHCFVLGSHIYWKTTVDVAISWLAVQYYRLSCQG